MNVTYKWKFPNIALFDEAKATELFKVNTSMFLDSVLTTVQGNVISEAPVGATTELRNKIIQKKVSYKKGYVISAAKYSAAVNSGRKAAPVSQKADASLEAWIKRSTAGRAYFNGLKSTYPKITVKSAIFLLKRAKKKKPTKANDFFDRGVLKSQPIINRMQINYKKQLASGLQK